MPDYRRAAIPGGTYFFTLVSYQRQKILCDEKLRIALRDAIVTTRTKLPFSIDACVLMPDHLHVIWTLPENDNAYSVRWSMIKRLVTQRVRVLGEGSGAHGAPYGMSREGVIGAHGAPYGGGNVGCAVRTGDDYGGDDVGCAARTGEIIAHGLDGLSASRLKRREGAIWQRRFWEHQIRDQDDLNRCLDYVHWNPVKHGYVKQVADWPYSTFHRFVREGWYPGNWGGEGVGDDDGFGE